MAIRGPCARDLLDGIEMDVIRGALEIPLITNDMLPEPALPRFLARPSSAVGDNCSPAGTSSRPTVKKNVPPGTNARI